MSIELFKKCCAILGAGVLLLFLWVVIGWPMVQEPISSANETFADPQYSNLTGLSMGIRATPILLFVGFGIVPILAIVAVVWVWRTGKFGGY